GESFGVFETKSVTTNAIRLFNEENVLLTRDSIVPLVDKLMFEVEDTPSVQYSLIYQYRTETSVDGDISYNNTVKTVSFDPVSNLLYNTTYNSYITTGAEDLAGNGLSEEYIWSFTTINYTVFDTTPLIITDVNGTVTSTTATITWNTTGDSSNSTVRYNESGNLTILEVINTEYVELHNILLGFLKPNTTYYYYVISTNRAGNTNESSIHTFTTLTVSVVTIHSPPSITNDSTPLLNATFDRIVTSAWYVLDGAASSGESNIDHLTITLPELSDGPHRVVVDAIDYEGDYMGNIGQAIQNFLIDTRLPTAIITEPYERAYVNGTINIVGTANDTNFKNYSVEWKNTSLDWTEIQNSTVFVSDGTLAIWDTTTMEDGNYFIRLTVRDNASNFNIIPVNVTIDNTPPNVTINSPANNSIVNSPNITILGNVTDYFGIKCFYLRHECQGGGGVGGVCGVPPYLTNITINQIVSLCEGWNLLSFGYIDIAGNFGNASIVLTLDTNPPTITIDPVTSPTNVSSQTITGTFDETGSDIDSITVNGVIATISGAIYSAIIGLTEGTNPVDAIAVDKAGNVGSNSTTIVLDTIAPAANITKPEKNTDIKYFKNIVRGEVFDEHLDNATLTVSSGSNVLTYDLTITENRFAQRVEFTPDQNNTLKLFTIDEAGNSNNDTIVVFVKNNTMQDKYNVNDSAPLYIDAVNETDTEIEFYSNVNASVTFIVTAITNQTLVDELNSSASVFGEMAMGKIVEINVTGLDATNESQVHHVLVKLYYTLGDLDLDCDGIVEPDELDEDNMFIYWYNESGNWTKLLKGDPLWVLNNGNEKISGDNPGYVWVDVNHLSMFALAALPVAEPFEDGENENGKGGGGGSSGGGGASGEDFYNIVLSETDRQSVFKNSSVSFIFDLEGNIVRHINFRALKSAGTVAAKVEILNNTSTLVSTPPPHEVFRNLNIWVGNAGWATEKNIADATVVFTVEKSWITKNNIDESSIALYRYSDDTWHKLVTKKIAEDANSLQFEAETPGFSPFAVTGKTIGEPGGEGIIEPTVTAEKTPAPTPTEKKGIPGFSLFAGLSVLLIAVQLLRKKN
ncbi:MAG: PGF-pre-PGF domain-containing protein, partial [Methanosarcinales archaeon]|nr:PGF-pre-PGF domain-containing protein [Methanosarcinales archaeon]